MHWTLGVLKKKIDVFAPEDNRPEEETCKMNTITIETVRVTMKDKNGHL